MINKLIIDSLKGLKIPIKFGIRGGTKVPCIIFNYYDEPYATSCDGEELTRYKILISIYHDGDFMSLSKKVNDLMIKNGFIGGLKPNAFYDDALKCWVKPLNYTIILESELIK